MQHKDKRNFIERLLGRREKEVLERDNDGNVLGKSICRYDKKGGLIEQIDSVFDSATQSFLVHKDKTYVRRDNGTYDPAVTVYYDDKERETTRREYDRDDTGMLTCHEEKYVYTPRGKKTVSELDASYDGGLWTKRYKEEKIFDSFGHAVQSKSYVYSSKTHGLVCVKDKTRVRNADGTYDPKETAYYDLEGRIKKHKLYHREQTELGSTLFGDEEEFSYEDGKQKAEKKDRLFLMGGGMWGTMKDFQELVAFIQAENAQKAAGKSDAAKGEKGTPQIDPVIRERVSKMDPR